MTLSNSPIEQKPFQEAFRLISGLSLVAVLAHIMTNPFQQTRHVQLNCHQPRIPQTLVEGPQVESAECLLVRSMSRNSSIWVD